MFERLLQFSDELVGLVDLVRESTVTITGMDVALRGDMIGSGWVYSHQGHIVTNHHVVDGMARNLNVQFAGRRAIPARVIGTDPETDLAVLMCADGAPFPAPLEMRLLPARLGELCFAVGSPLRFRESVSMGVVSGLSRQIPTDYGDIEESIQTDAAINPGNSGGPLVDCQGKVIGVNVAKLGSADNIGFAIAAEIVAAVVPELINYGNVVRGHLGISISEAWRDDGSEQQVISVLRTSETSPFQVGDVIRSVNKLPVRRRYDVQRALRRDVVGSTLQVTVVRAGSDVNLIVPVTARPPRTP